MTIFTSRDGLVTLDNKMSEAYSQLNKPEYVLRRMIVTGTITGGLTDEQALTRVREILHENDITDNRAIIIGFAMNHDDDCSATFDRTGDRKLQIFNDGSRAHWDYGVSANVAGGLFPDIMEPLASSIVKWDEDKTRVGTVMDHEGYWFSKIDARDEIASGKDIHGRQLDSIDHDGDTIVHIFPVMGRDDVYAITTNYTHFAGYTADKAVIDQVKHGELTNIDCLTNACMYELDLNSYDADALDRLSSLNPRIHQAGSAGVDSGQMMIADNRELLYFEPDYRHDDDMSPFGYGSCCTTTLAPPFAGILNHEDDPVAVVSRSCEGDGYYPVYPLRHYGNVGVLVSYDSRECDEHDEPSLTRLIDVLKSESILNLGHIDIDSGKVTIIDPCYVGEDENSVTRDGVTVKVRNGTYTAYASWDGEFITAMWIIRE